MPENNRIWINAFLLGLFITTTFLIGIWPSLTLYVSSYGSFTFLKWFSRRTTPLLQKTAEIPDTNSIEMNIDAHAEIENHLELLTNLIMKDFVLPWSQELTGDTSLQIEIREFLRHFLRRFSQVAQRLNVEDIICEVLSTANTHLNLQEKARTHLKHYGQILKDRSLYPGSSGERRSELYESYKSFTQTHHALASESAEMGYYKSLANLLISLVECNNFPELSHMTYYSKSTMAFLLDIFSKNLLKSITTWISDPDTIYTLISLIVDTVEKARSSGKEQEQNLLPKPPHAFNDVASSREQADSLKLSFCERNSIHLEKADEHRASELSDNELVGPLGVEVDTDFSFKTVSNDFDGQVDESWQFNRSSTEEQHVYITREKPQRTDLMHQSSLFHIHHEGSGMCSHSDSSRYIPPSPSTLKREVISLVPTLNKEEQDERFAYNLSSNSPLILISPKSQIFDIRIDKFFVMNTGTNRFTVYEIKYKAIEKCFEDPEQPLPNLPVSSENLIVDHRPEDVLKNAIKQSFIIIERVCYRRFAEFCSLHYNLSSDAQLKHLVSRFSSPFRLQTVFTTFNSETLKNRKVFLQNYLYQLSLNQLLCESEIFHQFLSFKIHHPSAYLKLTPEKSILNVGNFVQNAKNRAQIFIPNMLLKDKTTRFHPTFELSRIDVSRNYQYLEDTESFHESDVNKLGDFIETIHSNEKVSIYVKMCQSSKSIELDKTSAKAWSQNPLFHNSTNGLLRYCHKHAPISSLLFEIIHTLIKSSPPYSVIQLNLIELLYQSLFGSFIQRVVLKEISTLLDAEHWAIYLPLIFELIWPKGCFLGNSAAVSKTPEMRQVNQALAKDKLFKLFRSFSQNFLTKSAAERMAQQIADAFSDQDINQHNYLTLVDLLLKHLIIASKQ